MPDPIYFSGSRKLLNKTCDMVVNPLRRFDPWEPAVLEILKQLYHIREFSAVKGVSYRLAGCLLQTLLFAGTAGTLCAHTSGSAIHVLESFAVEATPTTLSHRASTSRFHITMQHSSCAGDSMKDAVPSKVWNSYPMSGCLSLEDLNQLSKTCKDWQHPVLSLFSSLVARQLVQALEINVPQLKAALIDRRLETAACDIPARQLQQLWTVVSFLQHSPAATPWGPPLAALPGATQDPTLLINVPDLPRSAVQYLVQQTLSAPQQSRVCLRYQQLIKAAYNRVAGAEYWVQVQDQLGIKTDIPELFVAICCGTVTQEQLAEWQPSTPRQQTQALLVALNSRSTATAHLVANELLPKVTNTAAVLHLLQTAVTRRHVTVLDLITDYRVMFTTRVVCMTPNAVQQLMQADIDALGSQGQSSQHGCYHQTRAALGCSMMDQLVQIPAANDLSMDVLRPLLVSAVRSKCSTAVEAMCTLKGAQLMQFNDCSALLELALLQDQKDAVIALCALPAASNVTFAVWLHHIHTAAAPQAASSAELALVLTAATKYRQSTATDAATAYLYGSDGLPATPVLHHISCDHINRLLTAALKLVSDDTDRSIILDQTLEALIALDQQEIYQLPDTVGTLMERCRSSLAGSSSTLHAAAEIPVDLLISYISAAIRQKDIAILFALVHHPQVVNIDVDAVQHSFSAVVDTDRTPASTGSTSMLLQQLLCLLPAANQICTDTLYDLLRAFVVKNHTLAAELVGLPVVQCLPASCIAALIEVAIEQANSKNVRSLCQLQQAKKIREDTLIELTTAAIDHGDDSMTTAVLELETAAIAHSAEYSQLLALRLEKALQASNGDLVRILCQLPAAKGLATDAWMKNVLTAINFKSAVGVYSLCQLPVATAALSDPAVALQLLRAAMQVNSSSVISSLSQLPGIRQLSADAVNEVVRCSEQRGDQQVTRALKRLLDKAMSRW